MANSNLKVSTLREQAQSGMGRKTLARIGHVPQGREEVPAEATFHALLTHERRRAERSRKPFVLMLLEMHALHAKSVGAAFSERVKSAISGATRETDLIGASSKDSDVTIFVDSRPASAGPQATGRAS